MGSCPNKVFYFYLWPRHSAVLRDIDERLELMQCNSDLSHSLSLRSTAVILDFNLAKADERRQLKGSLHCSAGAAGEILLAAFVWHLRAPSSGQEVKVSRGLLTAESGEGELQLSRGQSETDTSGNGHVHNHVRYLIGS